MNPNPTLIKLFIGIVLFATWVLLVVFKVDGVDDIITAIKLALAGLGAYHLNDRTNMPADRLSDKQDGHATTWMMALLAAGAALLMTGCAGMQQVVTGYESAAATSIMATNDNLIRVWTFQACGTPFSAAIRNPQIIPALKALCLPAGAEASPAALLESVPK